MPAQQAHHDHEVGLLAVPVFLRDRLGHGMGGFAPGSTG